MGFFDSFGRKKEKSIFENEIGLPPPPPKTQSNDSAKPPLFMPPPGIDAPKPPMPMPPILPPAQIQDSYEQNFMPKEMPVKQETTESLSIQSNRNIPGELPALSLPDFNANKNNVMVNKPLEFDESIPEFEDAEIAQSNLPELPVIDVEEKQGSFRYADLDKPLFVRTDYYKDVLSYLDTMKSHVDQSSDIIYSLENLKKNAEMEHRNFKLALEDIQRKLIYVDKILFCKEG